MTEQQVMWALGIVATILMTVVSGLLARKDKLQEEQLRKLEKSFDDQIRNLQSLYGAQVTELWKKHQEDADRLQQTELRLAREHYVKTELDEKFNKLELAFRDGFKSLGDKFDDLSRVLLGNGVGRRSSD